MSATSTRRPPFDPWRLLRAFLLGCYLALFATAVALLAIFLPLSACIAVLSVPQWLPPPSPGPRAGLSPRAPPVAGPPRPPAQ